MNHKGYDLDALQHDPEAVLSKLSADEVAELLEIAADAYYNKGAPLISDDLYDLIFDYLKKRDPKHPSLQRIGAPVAPGDKVKLPYWMGSLDKIRDDPKALDKWLKEYKDPPVYVISDKLDGNSGLLLYTKDNIMLYSRGDGNQGQNVSHLLKHIQGIVPADALKKKTSFPLAVRGELIISRKNWEEIKDLGANARNVVAGAMHAKIPNTKIVPHIEFIAYELLEPKMSPVQGLQMLRSLGFRMVDFHVKGATQMSMDALSEVLVRRRKASPYEIDGIVIYHDKEHRILKGKNPKHAFAFKSLLTHEEAEVVVTRVEWNVSKDGYIKPLVHFPTVVIEGAKISKATGFHAAFIEQHRIGPGSRIVIIRSGAVIPHIVRVISPSSNGRPAMPDVPYTWTNTHVDIMIQEQEGEKGHAMRRKQMEFFTKTLDIKHLGPGTIKRLYENGIDTIPKLLTLKVDDVKKIEGFQNTSAKNIVDALDMVRSVRCEHLMAASGLFGRGMGAKKLEPVLEAYPNIMEASAPIPSYEELRGIQRMGDVSARAVLDGIMPFRRFMQEIDVQCTIKNQRKKSSQVEKGAARVPASSSIRDMSGVNAVFTGFRNKEWEEKVSDAGGKISTSVSKNTTLVVTSDVNEDSTKLKKARELNIPIMSKEEFAKKYNI